MTERFDENGSPASNSEVDSHAQDETTDVNRRRAMTKLAALAGSAPAMMLLFAPDKSNAQGFPPGFPDDVNDES